MEDTQDKRTYLLVGILSCVALTVSAISIGWLYHTSFEQQQQRLIEAAKIQAKLVESVARFDSEFSQKDDPQGAVGATLRQLREAHQNYESSHLSGELVLGRRIDDSINFLIHLRHTEPGRDFSSGKSLPWVSPLAEPMRRALNGESGVIVGLDYRGERVLAAYEPVAVLGFGLVVKVDLVDIRRPFIQSGFIVVLVSIIIIIVASLLFQRVTNPMIRQIKDSASQVRLLLDSTAEPIYGIDTNGNCTFANPACANQLGYDNPNELLGKNIHLLAHHTHADGSHYSVEDCGIYQAHTKGESVVRDDEVFWRKDGSSFPVEYSAHPVYRDIQCVGTVVTFNDLTERKRAEQALKTSEERFELAVKGSSDGIWDWNILTGDDYFSPRFRQLLGFDEDDDFPQVVDSFLSRLHPDENDFVAKAVQEHLEHRAPYKIEMRMRKKDGSFGWFLSRGQAVWDKNGVAVRMAGSITDISDKKRYEQQLKEKQATLDKAQEIAHVGSWDWNIKTGMLTWSDEIYRIFGVQPGEFPATYEAFLGMIHPDDRKKVADAINNSVSSPEKIYDIEHRIIQPDGGERIVQEQGVVYLGRNGEPERMIGAVLDITQQKRQEEELLFRHKLAESIATALSVYVSDASQVKPLFGRMLNELLELTQSEYGFIGEVLYRETGEAYLKTQTITDISWNEETRKFYRENAPTGLEFSNLDTLFGAVIKEKDFVLTNSPQASPYSGGLPEGHPDLNAFAGIPLKRDGCMLGVIGIANRPDGYNMTLMRKLDPFFQTCVNVIGAYRDADERNKVRLELDKQREVVSSLLNNLPGMIYQCRNDERRTLEFTNTGCEKLTGYPVDDFLDGKRHYADLIHPDDVDEVWSAVQVAVKEKQQYTLNYRLRSALDEEIWVWERGRGFFNESGELEFLQGFISDVTQQKNAQEELDRHRNDLEELVNIRTNELRLAQDELVKKERLATLGQLTATVSHELRNPLGAIRPSLYLIGKRIDLKERRIGEAFERVERNIERCDQIIDELLDFTRITELNRKPVEIDNWLREVIRELHITDGVTVIEDFQLEGQKLNLDSSRFRRAVINVIENACHAMFVNSQPDKIQSGACLTVSTCLNKNRVEIAVSDNGDGIPEDVLPKIFEPLFSTKGFGVGLGLPAVKQILNQHDGGIEISTQQEQGTTMVLWLPAQCQEKNGVAA